MSAKGGRVESGGPRLRRCVLRCSCRACRAGGLSGDAAAAGCLATIQRRNGWTRGCVRPRCCGRSLAGADALRGGCCWVLSAHTLVCWALVVRHCCCCCGCRRGNALAGLEDHHHHRCSMPAGGSRASGPAAQVCCWW